MTDIASTLRDVLQDYPLPVGRREAARAKYGRYSYELGLMYSPGARIIDLGGGVAATSPTLAKLGCEVYVVDNFNRPYYKSDPYSCARTYIEKCGVRIIDQDILDTNLDFVADGSVECVASFDCVEHLHHSPAKLFEVVMRKLRRGGLFVLGIPNAVNIAKRVRVLFGHTNYSSFNEFYFNGFPFTGHVREFTAPELLQLGALLGLTQVRVVGRNWLGYEKGARISMSALRAIDMIFRNRPHFCSDLYMLGTR